MARKPTLKKPQPLTAAIIAYPKPGEERGDAQCAGLLDYLDALTARNVVPLRAA